MITLQDRTNVVSPNAAGARHGNTDNLKRKELFFFRFIDPRLDSTGAVLVQFVANGPPS